MMKRAVEKRIAVDGWCSIAAGDVGVSDVQSLKTLLERTKMVHQDKDTWPG